MMAVICLKVFIILCTCTIAFDASVSAAVRGDINPFETKQNYCGEILVRSIEILCIEMPRRAQFVASQNNITNPRNPRDVVAAAKRRRNKYKFLKNQCCVKACSLNYIKSNCPGTRKRAQKKNIGVIGNQKTKTNSTAKPRHKMSRFRLNKKKKTTTARSLLPNTVTTTVLPTTTTTTTSTTTTTTTTQRPTTTTEYYYDDLYYFQLPSS